ncbi:MAG: hypothetical protein RIT19_2876 [Verrucomicrobiota bacterium]|jgi:hypothetical protein
MRLLCWWTVLLCFVSRVVCGEFRTITGDVYVGEVSAADADGLIVRLQTGTFSPRIDWAKLDEGTLKALSGHPRAGRFVEPLLEPPAEEIARAEARKIDVRQPERVARPPADIAGKGVYAALTSPNGLMLLGALYLANLYAAFEIARFRWRPVPLVCGISAVLPVIGPTIFLALPRREEEEVVSATDEAIAAQSLNVPSQTVASASSAAAPGSTTTAARAAAVAQESLPKHFRRGETTFNRRFFETQFPSFFKVVASEADKDLVLEVTTSTGVTVASRITRISGTDLALKASDGSETPVEFAQVLEVKLRDRNA